MIEYNFICPNCKKRIFGNTAMKFCTKCGTELQLQSTEELLPKAETEDAELPVSEPKNTFLIEFENEMLVFEETMPNGFHVAVEETAQLGEPFVCTINEKGVKLYFKKGKKEGEYTHLIPLTKEELKSLNIEETANDCLQNYFPLVTIEEVV